MAFGRKEHTRRDFLKVAGAGTVIMALSGAAGCKPARSNIKASSSKPETRRATSSSPKVPDTKWTFRSRPDLVPPIVEVTTRAHDTSPGYVFIAPKVGVKQDGPMILDDSGRLVWFSNGSYARDFKVQRYQGNLVLTWWDGKVIHGHGAGEFVIFDESYREITRVRAGNGYEGDLHEFLISPQGTALILAYDPVPVDLSPVGGPGDGAAWDGIVQELDIETGEVLFEWHSLDHVEIDKSYHGLPDDPARPFDYFHVNSIGVDYDDNLLISARNTCAVYKVDRRSGEIIWRLGGKDSDFEMGPGTRPAYQHDARRQDDGTISIFDNGSYPTVHEQSRGIVLELDMDQMTASLIHEYTRPEGIVARSQGNIQILPNGNAFVGWGSEPFFSEYSSDGQLLFDARFASYTNESYRAFRFPWTGRPDDEPAVVAEAGIGDGEVTIYASWNGATEVASWRVLAGSRPDAMKPLRTLPREGFETVLNVQADGPYVGVQAMDSSDRVLGVSQAVEIET